MIFLDTNFLLDVLDDRRVCHSQAIYILSAVQKKAIEACMTSQSIMDASYVRTQTDKIPVADFRKQIATICSIVKIVSIVDKDIDKANRSSNEDYEDSGQIACAERLSCEMIVTSDRKVKKHTRQNVMSVNDYFSKLFGLS